MTVDVDRAYDLAAGDRVDLAVDGSRLTLVESDGASAPAEDPPT